MTNFKTQGENPSVSIAINKSRLKLYKKQSGLPTYYLNKGQEFQIELYNPTRDTVLAEINLNSKLISRGGLVLRPGERVFLDRYLDENRKFLFDTYNVANTQSAKDAIIDNGDIKVRFFREKPIPLQLNTNYTYTIPSYPTITIPQWDYGTCTTGTSSGDWNENASFTTSSLSLGSVTNTGSAGGHITLDGASSVRSAPIKKKKRLVAKKSKSIETGRVEKGSVSSQKLTAVDKEFEYSPFHTIEYKLLPISQKKVESKNLVRHYCPFCGTKVKAKANFCIKCGEKQ